MTSPRVVLCSANIVLVAAVLAAGGSGAELGEALLRQSGVRGGLVVVLGIDDGELLTRLHAGSQFLVQGLDVDPGRVATVRRGLLDRHLSGPVTADTWDGRRLPYVDNLVNLLVVRDPASSSVAEWLRVVAPGGVALVPRGGKWQVVRKPRPANIDEWGHLLHGADNNAVAHDTVVGPPFHLQWVETPRQTRHHEHLASISTVVSAGGRLFAVEDEAPAASIMFPSQWFLVARDAFNGVLLWKRSIAEWEPHLRPFRQGPPQLGRRLVALGDRVYVTLGLRAPVSCLDAATGRTVKVYPGTEGTEEILCTGDKLLLVIGSPLTRDERLAKRDEALEELLGPAPGWAEQVRRDAWDMNEPADVPGKGHVNHVQFTNGVMRFTTETDPMLVLNLDGRLLDRSYNLFAVRMYASGFGTGQVYYWSPDGDWQGYRFSGVRPGWHTYVFDLTQAKRHGPGGGSAEHWKWGGRSGRINKFRFDPVNDGGVDVRIDWIKLLKGRGAVRDRLTALLADRKTLAVVDANTGRPVWKKSLVDLLPTTVAADADHVFFWDRAGVSCLDLATGTRRWRHPRVAAAGRPDWSAPTLVVHGDVVLCADRDPGFHPKPVTRKMSLGDRLRATRPLGTLEALSVITGRRLWSCVCSEGYNSPPDVFVAAGLVWVGHTPARHFADYNEGRDLHTGQVRRRFDTRTIFAAPFHHRCFRDKATDRYLVVSKVGSEFIDLKSGRSHVNNWVRGTCQYGNLPCNGLLYVPPHSCACYIEGKVNGFWALAPRKNEEPPDACPPWNTPVEHGPAWNQVHEPPADGAAWPTYRHDAARSGHTTTPVPASLAPRWELRLSGRLTPPVIADGLVFVAQVDAQTVVAVDESLGGIRWTYTAGGRIDSPPTVYRGRVLFGCADGWVYCLRARDGELVWRFRAAPAARKIVAFGRVESAWPVSGSVLVDHGELFCVAGRSSYVDGGLFLYRVDPLTGRVLARWRLSSRDPRTGEQQPAQVHQMDIAGALPDILSSDGRYVFMRYLRLDRTTLQPVDDFQKLFQPDPAWWQQHQVGDPLYNNPERSPHLFCPTGFLDDSWWHRCYWMYGTFFPSCCPYFTAGVFAPAGRLLVFDDTSVFGFGRQPEFWGWWTPLRYQLFAASKKVKLRRKGWRKRFPADWQGVIRLGTYATRVPYRWREPVPFYVRALTLAGDMVFAAGPPEKVDETRIRVQRLQANEALVRKLLGPALEAWEGKYGALFRAVSTRTGRTIFDRRLPWLPIFDGMAAAHGNLYLSTRDGRLVCLRGQPRT